MTTTPQCTMARKKRVLPKQYKKTAYRPPENPPVQRGPYCEKQRIKLISKIRRMRLTPMHLAY